MGSGLDARASGASGSDDRTRPARWTRRAFLLLIAAQILVGLAWLASNLGNVPQYTDSLEYIHAAQTLEVDAYRGIAYPLLLAGIDRAIGEQGLAESVRVRPPSEDEDPETSPRARRMAGISTPESVALQLCQLAVGACSLAWFLRTFCAPLAGPGAAVLFLLLFTDPLVGHLQLAVLTDGLALSASLVFLAALVRYVLGRGRRAVAGAALFLSAFLAPLLRAEKPWVLAATVLGTLACWWLAERRREPGARGIARGPALQAAGIALAGVLVSLAVQQCFRGEGKRMPAYEFVLDQRILFPNLSAVYRELPEEVRARLRPVDAMVHDRGALSARKTIELLGDGDPALRRALIESSARVVLRERWPAILLDVCKDAAESVATPVSFYAHLVLLACLGEEYDGLVRGDYNRWTYLQLVLHHPLVAHAHLVLSGLSFFLCAVLSLAHVRRLRAQGATPVDRTLRLAWVPVGLFALANSLAFALATGLVHPRYAILAHVALLVLVYRGALGWAGAGRARVATP